VGKKQERYGICSKQGQKDDSYDRNERNKKVPKNDQDFFKYIYKFYY